MRSQPCGKRTVTVKALGICETVAGERNTERGQREQWDQNTWALETRVESSDFVFSEVWGHWNVEPRE